MVLWGDKTLTSSIAVSRAAAAVVPLIWSQSKNQRMLVYCVQISVWTEPQQFTKKNFIQHLTCLTSSHFMALCHSDIEMRRTNWDCATNLHIWPHTFFKSDSYQGFNSLYGLCLFSLFQLLSWWCKGWSIVPCPCRT